MPNFEVGDRVRLSATGNSLMALLAPSPPEPFQLELAEPGEWRGHCRTTTGRKGPIELVAIPFA